MCAEYERKTISWPWDVTDRSEEAQKHDGTTAGACNNQCSPQIHERIHCITNSKDCGIDQKREQRDLEALHHRVTSVSAHEQSSDRMQQSVR